MLNRLFGDYLVSKKIISSQILDRYLPVPTDMKASLDTIALINKALSITQILKLKEQIHDDSEFGDCAVEEGFLSDLRLEELLAYQTNPFMIFMQELLNDKVFDMQQIQMSIMDFQQTKGFSDAQVNSLILNDIEQIVKFFAPIKDNHLKTLICVVIKTLQKLIDKDVYIDSAYVANKIQLDGYAAQEIIGDFYVKLYLSGSNDHLLGIANYFTGEKYSNVDEDAMDTVCEFINCINGQFATELSYADIDIDMTAPEYSINGPFLENHKMYVIPIHANGYQFRAILETKNEQ